MTKKNKDQGIKTPGISKVAYFFGILCFIAGGIMIISGSLGAVVPGKQAKELESSQKLSCEKINGNWIDGKCFK